MNILILGSRGMLGQALVKEFSGAEHEATGWDKADLDITDKAKVLEKIGMLKPKIIINAAAYNNIDKAETEDRDLVFKINAEAVGNLVEASALVGAFFVYYSTDYVFRGDKIEGYSEVDAPDPQIVYAKSKFEGEKKAVGQYIIRTSRLFGPAGAGDGAKKSFVDIMLKLGREKDSLDLVDEEISSPTYVVDLARATRELIESGAPAGIYHRTNAGACTWYEWAREIFRLANLTVKLNPVSADKFPRPAPRPKFSKLITTKLSPLRSWEKALAEYLETN